jgi:hypothetical protein
MDNTGSNDMNISSTIENTKNDLMSFLDSNSLVAKFAFLLLVIFVFIILLQVTLIFMDWLLSPSNNSHLLDVMIPGNEYRIIPQDPSKNGSITIYRSVNAPDGLEFTWSIWIFINNLGNESNPRYKHIFHKGDDSTADNGLNFPNNSPGLYLSPNSNELTLIMNTFNVINEEVIIDDIPINKWVNVIIRCSNVNLDVYINGTISKSVKLSGVPKQNYGDVFLGMNGGFDGYTSNLWYYDYALGTAEIQRLVRNGPNTNMDNSAMNVKNPDYLSLRWYFFGNEDMYNP